MTAMAAMHGQVHQRACGQDQPGLERQDVHAMLDKQQHRSNNAESDQDKPASRSPRFIACIIAHRDSPVRNLGHAFEL